MGKTVGIMTLYYKTYNYGAQLQAYALQRAVEKLGHTATVIRFRWYESPLEQFYRYASANNVAQFERFSKSIPHSKAVYTPETIHTSAEDYDVFICGSDQIWGVVSMPAYVLPQITLSFVPAAKTKLSYAASMGGAAVSDRTRSILTQPLRRLDAVSVRETSAVPAVTEMAGKPVCAVLDPALLLSATEWDAIAVKPPADDAYIFVYNIGNNAQLDAAARQLAHTLNCDIRQISYSPEDAVGPAEFVGLIKHARYVLTNSFHGTVFSVLYHKDFLSFALDDIDGPLSKNIRMRDLLRLLGLEDRFWVGTGDLGEATKRTIDYAAVDAILARERRRSLEYLAGAIQLPQADAGEQTDAFADLPHPARDYLAAVAGNKTESELRYEKALVEKDLEIERVSFELYKETVRSEIYSKLLMFQHFGLALDYDPLLKGKVVIYGAGKIGRLACLCFDEDMLCFVDEFSEEAECVGRPVYRLEDAALRKALENQPDITFLITPVWDFEAIETRIRDLFPTANVVSVEKTVQHMWL